MLSIGINESYQGVICACMIFQPICFILYFVYIYTWLFAMEFVMMTSPRYCDVTHFLTESNKICTACVKLEI